MSAARPLVTVFNRDADAKSVQVVVPAVLVAPIRADIVRFVHTNMNKNRRQAYAVSPGAGHQHSAESWGTGRAVSRIPRVSGGGTSRAGQAAFGNMCRKGRMFAPTRTWRKWHRKINTNQKRYAVASALAASAIPALVMARGHQIAQVNEVPLVVDDSVESIQKTREAVEVLKAVGAFDDVARSKASRKLTTGRGKLRGRRHVQRRGPLVVFANDNGITQAFRNLPGVDLAHVDRLNLLQLAPGGHVGRFIVWTASAFQRLNETFGSVTRESAQKTGYTLPRNIMTNSDLTRIINSDEIQSRVRPATKNVRLHSRQKKNPLKNLGVKARLNPYSVVLRRAEIISQERRAAQKAARVEDARAGKKTERTNAEQAKIVNRRTHRATQLKTYQRMLSE